MILVAGSLLAATSAHAQNADEQNADEQKDRFFIRGGPAFSTFDATAKIEVAGTPVSGGDASVKNNTGFAFEGGYFVRPNVAVALTIGIPPTARINGDGTLGPAGLLGTASYGPAALSLQYYAPTRGRFRPYVGAGYNYTLVYNVRGSSIRDLRVSNGNGPLVQAGAEYRVSRHFAFFADIKKIWVAVNGSGFIDSGAGRVPATARLSLDPLIVNTGISWHF
jgi:outer membrane protein